MAVRDDSWRTEGRIPHETFSVYSHVNTHRQPSLKCTEVFLYLISIETRKMFHRSSGVTVFVKHPSRMVLMVWRKAQQKKKPFRTIFGLSVKNLNAVVRLWMLKFDGIFVSNYVSRSPVFVSVDAVMHKVTLPR